MIVPVLNEQETLLEFYHRSTEALSLLHCTYEIIFINDGSRDRSESIIKEIIHHDKNVKLINFSRNFGQQIAITAGLDYAKGEAAIVLDSDLQDPPELIPEMIKKWKEGYQVVYAKRKVRLGETLIKKLSSKLFYRLINKLSTDTIPLDVGDFRLLNRQVIDDLKEMREINRYVRGMTAWLGYRQTSVEFVREKRYAGDTKYSLSALTAYAIGAIVSFSYKPLRLAIYLGFLTAFAGLICLIFVIFHSLFTSNTSSGWASLISVSLLFNGIILLVLGIIGEYIGRIFTETKKRPLYIIESKIGWDDQSNE